MDLQHHAECAVDELNTLQDVIRWSVSRMSEAGIYYGHGTDNPWDEALLLVTHALHLPWNLANEWRNAQLTRTERQAAIDLILTRIEQRVPAPYLTGVAWFCNLPFVVDERVLIPRSPFAELIQSKFVPHLEGNPTRILDMCTGGGCIAIALAYAFDEAQVDAVDISGDALAVAELNIEEHGLSERVFPLYSDLFSQLEGQQYDLIVSNPPYVDAEDMADLPVEFQHEPELALAAGNDGLDLVEIMIARAGNYLTEQGVMFVEVGNSLVHMESRFPGLDIEWVELAQGGHGIFAVTKAALDSYNQQDK